MEINGTFQPGKVNVDTQWEAPRLFLVIRSELTIVVFALKPNQTLGPKFGAFHKRKTNLIAHLSLVMLLLTSIL